MLLVAYKSNLNVYESFNVYVYRFSQIARLMFQVRDQPAGDEPPDVLDATAAGTGGLYGGPELPGSVRREPGGQHGPQRGLSHVRAADCHRPVLRRHRPSPLPLAYRQHPVRLHDLRLLVF